MSFIGEQESDTIRDIQTQAGVIYIWTYMCHNSSACHVYLMWTKVYINNLLSLCDPRNGCKNDYEGKLLFSNKFVR